MSTNSAESVHSSPDYRREVFLPLSIVATILLVATIAMIYVSFERIQNTKHTANIDALRFDLLRLHDTVVAAETGQRGYLLTSNVTFLTPYYDALEWQKTLIPLIKEKLTPHDNLIPHFNNLVRLIRYKIDIIERTLQIQLTAGSYASHLTLTKDQGKIVMEQINQQLQSIDNILAAEKENLVQQNERRLKQIILGGILLLLLVLSLLVFSYKQTLSLFNRITLAHNMASALRIEAHYDSLTQIHNRRGFEALYEEMFNKSLHRKNSFAVFYMDLDGFKEINDNMGHDIGDEALKICVQRFKHVLRDHDQILREHDTIARLGGDEFAILITHFKALADLAHLATRLIQSLETEVNIGKYKVKLGVSIGIASFPYHASNKDDLLTAADEAMYDAKKAGKNQYRFSTKQA